MPIQCGMLLVCCMCMTGSLTLIVKTTLQACTTLLRASHAVGPCPEEFSILCSHYSKEDSKAWAGCVCVHINAKDFCNRRRWGEMFLPQEHLGCLHFSFLLRTAAFSFQWLTWTCLGTVLREKRRQRAQHGTRKAFLPQGKDRSQVICEWGVPNCWKLRYRTRGQEALAGRRHGNFFRACLIIVVIKRKIDIPCFFYRMVVEYYFTAKFAAHCTLLQELTLVGFGSGLWNRGLKQSLSAH